MECNKTNCMECKFGGQSDGCHFDEESYNQALKDMKKYILNSDFSRGFRRGYEKGQMIVAAHDKQIRADAIDGFQEWLKTQIVGIDNKTKEILVVREDRWELAIDEYNKQLKEQK